MRHLGRKMYEKFAEIIKEATDTMFDMHVTLNLVAYNRVTDGVCFSLVCFVQYFWCLFVMVVINRVSICHHNFQWNICCH